MKDSNTEGLSLSLIPIVNEFTMAFLDDLPGVPFYKEIELGIDLLLDTRLISITP